MTLPPLPAHAGSYRWIHADFGAGDLSAVCMFLIGSQLSRRYQVGSAAPLAHCGVSFALYRGGQRLAAVLSEYRGLTATKARWQIGQSTIERHADGTVHILIEERSTGGAPVTASLVLQPIAPPLRLRQLIPSGTHVWQALAPRARATLRFAGERSDGYGYLDTRAGAIHLGSNLQRWTWSRAHDARATEIRYAVEGGLHTRVRVHDGGVEEHPLGFEEQRRSFWGLRLPRAIAFGDAPVIEVGGAVDSTPFFARQHHAAGGVSVLCESADFQRFRSPLVGWVVDWRTRLEAV